MTERLPNGRFPKGNGPGKGRGHGAYENHPGYSPPRKFTGMEPEAKIAQLDMTSENNDPQAQALRLKSRKLNAVLNVEAKEGLLRHLKERLPAMDAIKEALDRTDGPVAAPAGTGPTGPVIVIQNRPELGGDGEV